MSFKRSPKLKFLLDKWPGKKYLGEYRFLPLFFILGATLEFSMINWQVGETNFSTQLFFYTKSIKEDKPKPL